MTDDLVRRLREDEITVTLCHIAAARIEELEKQLSASNRNIMDLEEKIEELEYEIYELGTRND